MFSPVDNKFDIYACFYIPRLAGGKHLDKKYQIYIIIYIQDFKENVVSNLRENHVIFSWLYGIYTVRREALKCSIEMFFFVSHYLHLKDNIYCFIALHTSQAIA